MVNFCYVNWSGNWKIELELELTPALPVNSIVLLLGPIHPLSVILTFTATLWRAIITIAIVHN